jgi:2-keto-4-pentenoate hydratase/2-oxohepta-3-ene-1,7-dioic acid hydratase in catechol pathway
VNKKITFTIGNTTIDPTKIICLGRNYVKHAKEMKTEIPKDPIFFVKTLNTLLINGKPIIYPKMLYDNQSYNQVDYEVELAFIISRNCKNIQLANAYDYIEGYTVFLDMTARKMQISDRNINLPWYRSKNFDTFGPIGPKIVPKSDIEDPHHLNLQLKINGEIRQDSNTKFMIFKIPEILVFLSKFITLVPGDIVATGTPSGVGPVQIGDIIDASIEKIGKITHKVILEQ